MPRNSSDPHNLFLYGLRHKFYKNILKAKNGRHTLILRGLYDINNPDKPIMYDVVIDGVIGVDAKSIRELNEVIMNNYYGIILEMWNQIYKRVKEMGL